jgi:hypothetical protein
LKRDREYERERKNSFQQEKLDRNKYGDCGELEEKELPAYWQPGGGALIY